MTEPHRSRSAMRLRLRPPFLLLVAALLVVFRHYWLHPLELPYSRSSDLIRHYLPFKQTLYTLFQATGRVPGWDPHGLAGHPLSADPGYAAFYPLGAFFYVLPPHLVFSSFFLLHIALGAGLMYALLRRHGLTTEASALGTLAWSLNLKLVTTLYAGFATMVPAQAWMPGAFLAVSSFRGAPSWPRRMAAIAGLGLAIGMQILAGDAQLAVYTVMLLVPYALFVPVEARGILPRRPFFALSAVALGVLLAVGVAWPQIHLSRALTGETARAAGLPYPIATLMSLPPSHLPAMFFPSLAGSDVDLSYRGPSSFWEVSFYPGLLVWLLAGLALMRYRADRRILPLALLTWLALLVSFGKYTPIYTLLYYLVPMVDHFRGPARALPLAALFLALLGAIGLDELAKAEAARDRRRLQVTAAVGALACLGVVGWLAGHQREMLEALQAQAKALIAAPQCGEDSFRALVQGFGMTGLTLLVFAGLLAWRTLDAGGGLRFKRVVLVLVAFDLIGASRGLLETRPLADVVPEHALARGLEADTRAALAAGDGTPPLAPPRNGEGKLSGDSASQGPPGVGKEGKSSSGSSSESDPGVPGRPRGTWTALAGGPHGRVLDLSGALPDAVAAQYGLELVNGLNPLVLSRPYRFARYLQGDTPEIPTDRTVYGILLQAVKHPRLLDLLRVTHIVTPDRTPIAGFTTTGPVTGTRVYQQFMGMATYPELYVHRRTASLPVAWVVGKARALPADASAALAELEGIDPFRVVLVEGGTERGTAQAGEAGKPGEPGQAGETGETGETGEAGKPGEPGQAGEAGEAQAGTPIDQASRTAVVRPGQVAQLEAWLPDEMTMTAEAPAGGGWLVLSEVYAPGWKAEVDGRPTEVRRVDFLLRGVRLAEGRHRVRWRLE